MLQATLVRYNDRVAKAEAKLHVSATPAGIQAFRTAAATYQVAVEELKADVEGALSEGRALHQAEAFLLTLFADLDAKTIAAIVTARIIDAIGRGDVNYVLRQIRDDLNRQVLFLKAEAKDKTRYRQIARSAWEQTVEKSRAAAKAQKWLREAQLADDYYPAKDFTRALLLLMELFRVQTGLVDYETVDHQTPNGKSVRKKSHIVPTPATKAWFDQAHRHLEFQRPITYPLHEEPLRWSTLWDGGYGTIGEGKDLLLPLIATHRESMRRMKDMTEVDAPVFFSAINALQRTVWEVSPTVLEVQEFLWDLGQPVAGLPTKEPGDPIPHTEGEDKETAKRIRTLNGLRMREDRRQQGNRIDVAKALWQARKVIGKPLHFVYFADFRGRCYQRSSYLQYQAADHQRGLLRFARGKAIGTEAAEFWFLIHGANCYGVDKVPFAERIAWVESHRQEILEVAADPLSNRWWTDADKPFVFLAWCEEYAGYQDKGLAFESKLPIAMDGANNGLQCYSLLLGDEAGAIATNCRDSAAPNDVYMEVARLATFDLMNRAAGGCEKARAWLDWLDNGEVPRECVKRPVMTFAYGVTRFGINDQINDWYKDLQRKRGDGRRLGLPKPFEGLMLLGQVISDATGLVVRAAAEGMRWLRSSSDLLLEHGVNPQWVSPTGVLVYQGYPKFKRERVELELGRRFEWLRRPGRKGRQRANGKVAHKVQTDLHVYDERRPDKSKHRGGVAPNFIHSLDASAMHRTVDQVSSFGVEALGMIHDSYATHAADCPLMARELRAAYAETFNQRPLERLAESWQALLPEGVSLPSLPERGSYSPDEVREATYFFH